MSKIPLSDSPEFRLINTCRTRGWMFALAESCTGGLVAARVTNIPGASSAFLGGVVTYSNTLKQELLNVPESILIQAGAVSSACAKAMAVGARQRLGANLAAAITGIAGPDGGTDIKPVGTIYFGISTAEQTASFHRLFAGDRETIRQQAADYAITLLLESAETLH